MSYTAMQEQLDVCREINAALINKLAAINAALNDLDFNDDGQDPFWAACGRIDSILNGREVKKP